MIDGVAREKRKEKGLKEENEQIGTGNVKEIGNGKKFMVILYKVSLLFKCQIISFPLFILIFVLTKAFIIY